MVSSTRYKAKRFFQKGTGRRLCMKILNFSDASFVLKTRRLPVGRAKGVRDALSINPHLSGWLKKQPRTLLRLVDALLRLSTGPFCRGLLVGVVIDKGSPGLLRLWARNCPASVL